MEGTYRQRLIKSRSKLITIRLTPAEYDRLREMCLTEGARSMSDFTRSKLVDGLSLSNGRPFWFGDDLNTVSRRLHQLRDALHQLDQCIERVCGVPRRGQESSD